jgi:NAD(P)-dependent dehydrogenase (short-subunit alcohol dehydrogenase family)
LKDFSLDGKTAVVTGAGQGIGKGIALTMAEAGANIVAVDINANSIFSLAPEVRQWGKRYLPIEADVTHAEDVQKMADRAISEFGKIDTLVNNVGIRGVIKALIPLPDVSPSPDGVTGFSSPWNMEEWHEVMNTDLDSVFLCTKTIGPHMIEQKDGRIINIVSSWAFSGSGSDLNVPFCSAKAAIVRFTEALACEWAKYGVNINAIGPGLVQTETSQEFITNHEDTYRKYLNRIPQGKFGTTRDVGLLAVYLASSASSWMTGQVIYINGGETIA